MSRRGLRTLITKPKEMKKKLVVFDLDGTLLDTIADLAEATNYALRRLGYPTHSVETIRSFVGNGINKLLERALPQAMQTEEGVMCMRTHFIPYYNEHNADLSSPYPGVESLLKWLQDEGVQIAVASNKYQQATEKLVTYYFPEVNFVAVFGQRADVPIKPAPAVVHEIMSIASVSADETLYVGDSGVDMQTAQNAGVDAVGVSWGFRPVSELETFGPKAVIAHADELRQFV